MAFASFHTLVRIKTSNAAAFGRLYRLTIHDDDGGTNGSSGLPSYLLVHLALETSPDTIVLPGPKVVVDRVPRWKLSRKQTPLAACSEQIEDGIQDNAKVGFARSRTMPCCR